MRLVLLALVVLPAAFAAKPPKVTASGPPYAPGGALFFVRRVANGNVRLMFWRAGPMYGPIATVGSIIGGCGHHDWWSAADWRE